MNGTLSNATFIAIAPDANSSACVAPDFTTSQLQEFDNGGTFTVGSLVIDSFSETISGVSGTYASIGGGFIKYTGFQLASFASTGTSTTNYAGIVHGHHRDQFRQLGRESSGLYLARCREHHRDRTIRVGPHQPGTHRNQHHCQ